MVLPMVTIGISVVVAQRRCRSSRPNGPGHCQPDHHLHERDDGRRRNRLRRLSHQPLSRLCAAGCGFGSSGHQGVDVHRQGDRRVRGHRGHHVSRDDLHQIGNSQKRRAGVGNFDRCGILCRGDFITGVACACRAPRLDRAAKDLTRRLWRRSGIHIVRRPKTHLVASLLVLIILAGCAGLAHYNYDDRKTLPATVESSVGYAALDKHFPTNLIIPEYLFVQSPHDLRTAQGLADLEQMAQRVSQVPGIAVRPGHHPTDRRVAGAGQGDLAGGRGRHQARRGLQADQRPYR